MPFDLVLTIAGVTLFVVVLSVVAIGMIDERA